MAKSDPRSNCLRVALESPLPERRAEYHGVRILAGTKRAAQAQHYPERREIIPGDENKAGPRRCIAILDTNRYGPTRGDDAFEGGAALAEVMILGIREPVLRVAAECAREPSLDPDDMIGIRHRERLHCHRIVDRKQRRIHADTQANARAATAVKPGFRISPRNP